MKPGSFVFQLHLVSVEVFNSFLNSGFLFVQVIFEEHFLVKVIGLFELGEDIKGIL